MCVVAESASDGKTIVFSELDCTAGKSYELKQFHDEHAVEFNWDLSADGAKLVLHKNIDSGFRILPLGSGVDLDDVSVRVDDGTHIRNLLWDCERKGVFASAPSEHGAELVYVDLKGKVRRLWELRGSNVFLAARPSPDGHYLAIQASAGSSNIWMLENF